VSRTTAILDDTFGIFCMMLGAEIDKGTMGASEAEAFNICLPPCHKGHIFGACW
jgi:hypothetical protein